MATVREARRPAVPVPTEPAERRPFRDNPRLILLGIVVLFAALAAMIFLADKSTQLNPDFMNPAAFTNRKPPLLWRIAAAILFATSSRFVLRLML